MDKELGSIYCLKCRRKFSYTSENITVSLYFPDDIAISKKCPHCGKWVHAIQILPYKEVK